jgi:hypothetical protein
LGQIHFVCKNKKIGVTQLILVHHLEELIVCFLDTFAIIRVNNKNEPFRILELRNWVIKKKDRHRQLTHIMSPERPDFILTTDIPNCEVYVFVLNSLNIKSYIKKENSLEKNNKEMKSVK